MFSRCTDLSRHLGTCFLRATGINIFHQSGLKPQLKDRIQKRGSNMLLMSLFGSLMLLTAYFECRSRAVNNSDIVLGVPKWQTNPQKFIVGLSKGVLQLFHKQENSKTSGRGSSPLSHIQISRVWELNIDVVNCSCRRCWIPAAPRSFLCCSSRGGSGAVLWNRLMLYCVKTA